MIGKGATPSFFAIANDNYTLTNILVLQTWGALRIINFRLATASASLRLSESLEFIILS